MKIIYHNNTKSLNILLCTSYVFVMTLRMIEKKKNDISSNIVQNKIKNICNIIILFYI